MDTTAPLIAAAIGYLLGSIPSGLILTQLAGLGDIRQIGSGNIGATNVLRTGNRVIAALTLLLDILKGAGAVWLAPLITGSAESLTESGASASHFAGLAAFLGHLYPVSLGFKGGKGVATYIGVVAALFWPAAAVFCVVWLLVAAAMRYSSLAALAAAIAAPVAAALFSTTPTTALLALMSTLLIFKHHANIRRLLDGKEPKIGAES